MATALSYGIAAGISLTAIMAATDSLLPEGFFETPVKVARYYPIIVEQDLKYEVSTSDTSLQNLTVQKTCKDPIINRNITPNQVLLAHHYNYYGKGVYEVVCIN